MRLGPSPARLPSTRRCARQLSRGGQACGLKNLTQPAILLRLKTPRHLQPQGSEEAPGRDGRPRLSHWSAQFANVEEATRFAGRLRRAGCQVALDDFGAGFGSFYYLKYLPFDLLKIDGDFAHNFAAGPIDQLLLAT
ncbi:MAG: hypothetical protein DMF90_24350 [Acidobacteria bacterium]|nr:MAG: hypothetical protein DMF90_24350 [Acidobacteriota bacterium]